MKTVRLLAALVAAAAVSGCGATRSGVVLYFTRGVNLTIVHTCTDRAMVYHGQDVLANMVGVAPKTVPIIPFPGSNYATVTTQSLDASGRVVLTSTQSVYMSDYEQEQAWFIGDGQGGAGARYRSSCR